MSTLYRWDKPLAALLMLSFVLPPQAQVLVLIPLCLFFAIRDAAVQKGIKGRSFIYALFIGCPYLLYAIYAAITPAPFKQDVLFHLEAKSALLLLPLCMACLRRDTILTVIRQLHWFVIGTLAGCIWGNASYIIGSYPFTDPGFLSHVNYRLSFEDAIVIHPTFMGMYLCLSAAIILFCSEQFAKLKEWQTGALLFLCAVFLLALFPKTPLIALLLILAYFCAVHFRDRTRWRTPIAAIGLAVLAAFAIPFSSQRAAELKGFFGKGKADSPADNSINMRKIIWNIDRQMLNEHWLSGVGPGRIRPELQKKYAVLSDMAGLPLAYHDTHNEFLNIWISFGLAGIVLLLTILIAQSAIAIRQRNHLYICLLATLCICFLTENVLANQRGLIFYAFFTTLFFFACLGAKTSLRNALPSGR